MSSRANPSPAVAAATICAFAMIAYQIAGKAARDTLFLLVFDVTMLPRMVIVASLVTIGAVVLASRLLPRFGPGRLVPAGFALSSVLVLTIWSLLGRNGRLAGVALYLHMASFGAVLISWFWALVTERLDPRTARRRIGMIAGGGTFGGLAGGIAAERVGAYLPPESMFPLLAGLQAVCAVGALRFATASEASASPASKREEPSRSGFGLLREVRYLRNLALLVTVGTAGAGLLDYVFKAQAVETFDEAHALLRFFAAFYTGIALLTVLVQSTLTRRALLSLGPSRTVSFLPFFMGVGGLAALFVPGFAMAGVVRGAEAVTRSSLFRSAYELFYTPMARNDRRATKTIVDVGFDRLGDALGACVIFLALLAGAASRNILLALTVVLAVVGLLVARRLHQGYVAALEKSLLRQADRPSTATAPDDATRETFLQTVAQIDLTAELPQLAEGVTAFETVRIDTGAAPPGERPERDPAAPPPITDPVVAALAALRSGEATRVRRTLRAEDPLRPELVPGVIPLLAWDPVASDAQRALQAVCDRHVGQLVDALLDPDEDFAIRRRIPRVLAFATNERAVFGLLRGLADRRFEVRYQCGVALARIHRRDPDRSIRAELVIEAVLREAKVDRRVWEGHRLLDDPAEEAPFFDEVLRERASRSLEHVFTILSLIYPEQPLRIAYRGLHADDTELRGTALEYLESILPENVREGLWPVLDDERRPASTKTRQEILDSLLRSHDSIQIDLEQIRKRMTPPPPK